MKKAFFLLVAVLGWFGTPNAVAQAPVAEPKLSIDERMAKARAAKAEKRSATPANVTNGRPQSGLTSQRATAADYRTPVDKAQKGPNGEAVHVGERGGKFYINKNGNKTYLSSNQ